MLLLMGAAFASVAMVDLPAPAGSATGGRAMAQTPVPTSDKWIALGSGASSRVKPMAAAVDSRDTPTPVEVRQGRKVRGVQVASIGREPGRLDRIGPSLTGGSTRWNASAGCLNATLRRVLGEVAASFGAVTVNSTCRSRRHNARAGGARHSQHLTGNAADFRIGGNPHTVLAFLSSHRSIGGLKHYGGGVFHIDTGPRRTW